MLPGIMSQLGPESIQDMKKMMGQLSGSGGGSGAVGGGMAGIEEEDEGDDDDGALRVFSSSCFSPLGSLKPVRSVRYR